MSEKQREGEKTPESFTPSDDGKRTYSETRKDLLTRLLSNSEAYDKAILSLSSALLGVSLAFIKDIVHLGQACHKELLYFSWYLFAAAIIITLISFIMSNLGIKKQLKYAEKYYLEGESEYLKKLNIYARLTEVVNILSGGCFVGAVILTVLFVTRNI